MGPGIRSNRRMVGIHMSLLYTNRVYVAPPSGGVLMFCNLCYTRAVVIVGNSILHECAFETRCVYYIHVAVVFFSYRVFTRFIV